jgi:DNA-binding PadR family transcriptional regulator
MLSKLEELILLAVYRGRADVTAGDVQDQLSKALGREQQFGSVFTSLDRLSEKKLVRWKKGEPDAKRGGRAPRLYEITAQGRRALDASLRATSAVGGEAALGLPGFTTAGRGAA